MGGVQVTFTDYGGAISAPLFYVSPNQINFQVPTSIYSYGGIYDFPTHVVVTMPVGTSDPVAVYVAQQGPGILTLDGSGCGQGALLNSLPDGGVQVHGPSASVQPGDWISVYFTGFGLVGHGGGIMPPDGQPAGYTPQKGFNAAAWPGGSFTIGSTGGAYASSQYWGHAPGTVGIDQANFRIPDGVAEGCQVPLRLLLFGRLANRSR